MVFQEQKCSKVSNLVKQLFMILPSFTENPSQTFTAIYNRSHLNMLKEKQYLLKLRKPDFMKEKNKSSPRNTKIRTEKHQLVTTLLVLSWLCPEKHPSIILRSRESRNKINRNWKSQGRNYINHHFYLCLQSKT